MPQFTPSDAETVVETAQDLDHVMDATKVGNSVAMVLDSRVQENRLQTYGSLMENFGWYVATYERYEAGDTVMLQPVSEVNVDD